MVDISPFRELVRKLWDQAVKRVAGVSRRDMNPIEHWLKTRPGAAGACEQEYKKGMDCLKNRKMPEKVLAELEENWRKGGECQLYTLTAVRALCDVVLRFARYEI